MVTRPHILRKSPRILSRRRSRALIMEALESRQMFSLIGVTLNATPIIAFSDSTPTILHYSAANQDLSASAGLTLTAPPGIVSPPGTLAFDIKVDNTGNLTGTSTPTDLVLSDSTGTLLTGQIAKFGYQYDSTTSADFDFVFHPTGGSLLLSFAGQDIGVIINADKSTFLATSSFQSDFFTDVKGFAGPIPGGGSPPPVINTVAGAPVVIGSNTKLTDTATLSGGNNPTGSITFTLTAPGGAVVDTETVGGITGDGTYTTPNGFLPTLTVGTYTWSATFTSSTDGTTVTDNSGTAENELVTPATPTITTNAALLVNSTIGSLMQDSATVSGSFNGTGTITFTVTGPDGITSPVGTVAVSGDNTYKSPTVATTEVGTYTFHASYSGDALNNGAVDNGVSESVTTTKATPTLNTVALDSSLVVGGASLSDQLVVAGGFNPTGLVTFTVTNPNGTTSTVGTVTLAGDGTYTSPSFIATLVGTYTFHASYAGDAFDNIAGDLGGVSETITTIKASPSIATVASDTINVVGSAVMSDKVIVSGGDSPTGTVTFTLTAPNGTTTTVGTVTINGDGTYSLPSTVTATQVGTYTWHASYAGDSLNNGAIDGGANESLITIKASPSIATVASDTTNVVGSAVMSDKVIVSGGDSPTGTVTFTLTAPNGTTTTIGTVTISGDATYSLPTTVTANQVGTYTWHASYAGDSLNNGAIDNGANESLTTTPTTPTLVTTAIVVTTTSNCTNNSYNCGSYKGGSYSIGCGGYTIDCSKNNYNWCGGAGGSSGSSGSNTTIAVTHDTAALSGGFSETGTITFVLTDQNGNVIDTEKVNVNGNGNYTTSNISITNPSGTYTWAAVYSGDKLNASVHDQGGVNEQFAFNNGGMISGTKFLDITGNGFSSDDTPLAGVTIQVYNDANGNGVIDTTKDKVIATATTDANGNYSFTGIAAGNYIVQEVNPAGYVQTGPVSGQYAINLTANGSSTGDNFDDYLNNCVVKCWSYQVNGCTNIPDISGQLHQGDVVRVTFTTTAPGTVSFVSYTAPDSFFNANDASQQVIFDQDVGVFTAAGTYSLTIVVPNCDYQVDFVCGLPIDKLGPAGSNIFYTAQGRLHDSDNGGTCSTPPVVTTCNGTGSIAGSCFADDNNNGKKDTGECGLAGTKVTCYGNTNDGKCVIIHTTCDANGNYKFANLPAGTYKVIEDTPNLCYDGSDSLGTCGGTRNNDVCTNIVIGSGKSGTGYNFGELVSASICGTVFGDKDKDGTVDSNESGIAGVKITLTGTNDLGQTVTLTTTTDANGNYMFTDLRQGIYTLTETEPVGYVTTKNTVGLDDGTKDGTLSGDSIKSIALSWSDDATGYNFGDYKVS